MYTKIHWLHQFDNTARLGIMARPRGGEWLEQEIVQFKKQGIHIIVSLLESQEISELGLNKEKAFCESNGLEYINFPITDRSIPTSIDKTKSLIEYLNGKISEGRSIATHCRMGIGRSSIIAGCLLLKAGYKPKEVISHISKARGLKVPDTDEQEKWLLNVFNK